MVMTAQKMEGLDWKKCGRDIWCRLRSVDLSHKNLDGLEGVYVIWHGGITPKVVYVGKGNIRQRLSEHRHNKSIQRYSNWVHNPTIFGR